MGYNWVKTGVNLYKYAVISTPEKKGGNGEKKNLKFHVFLQNIVFIFLDF